MGLTERCNHNLHYHRVIMGAIPEPCGPVLDVGCGQGLLTRRLAARAAHVTGIDRDQRSIEIARGHPGGAGIDYLCADFFSAPLRPSSFDLLTSVAALHHMNAEAALERMAGLLAPGGILAVVGLARRDSPADLLVEIPALLGSWTRHAVSGWRAALARAAISGSPPGGQPAAPYQSPIVWPPPASYREMRGIANRVLPGVRYRRHLYGRFSLVWTKPGG